MGDHEAFWLDRRRDREQDGEAATYAEHVRRNVAAFEGSWGDIAPVTFACAAWRLATTPTPPYVRWHRRILSAACDRNPWDGSLTARILLVSPLPAQLTASRDWWQDRGWREWPQTFGQYLDPTDRDLTRNPFLRTALLVDAPVPLDGLPPAPDGAGETLAGTADLAVAALVKTLNDLVNPIIRRLEITETPG